MRMRPSFIFADENHQSPLLGNLLARLAPQFKQVGYDHFFYECSSEFSREQIINFLQDQINLSEAGKTILPEIKEEILDYLPKPIISKVFKFNFDALNNNELNYDFLILRITNAMNKKKDTPYEFYLGMTLSLIVQTAMKIGKYNMSRAVIGDILTNMVKEYKLPTAACEANIRMLRKMAEFHIEYKGVDDPVLRRKLTGGSTWSQALDFMEAIQTETLENIEKRNKTMVEAYLQSSTPFIGFTGMMHVTGMQQLLTTMIPADVAKANYHFIYVYREPLNEGAPELIKIREEMRTGKLALPLGLILVDGVNKTEEEIAAEIMLRIGESIEVFHQLPDQLKLIPDISFAGQVRVQIGNLFGLFNRAKDGAYQATLDAAATVRRAMNL